MGGNTFNRQHFSIREIEHFVSYAIKYPLKSLWSKKQFKSEKSWRADVPRLLDNESSKLFYFLLETYKNKKYCSFCNTLLGIESFNHVGWNKGFAKYCPECTINGVWRKNQSKEQRLAKGRKISQGKLSFYQTEKGKETAKEIGRKNSIKLKEFYQTEKGKEIIKRTSLKNSKIMKEKILLGEFTPNSNNRNTHWDSSYNGKKYRSSWEALYQYFYPDDEYETLRIEYKINSINSIYILDFINYNNKIVTEVKPAELCNGEIFITKYKALECWALKNNFTIQIADQHFFKKHGIPSNLECFDNNTKRKILKLYE